MTDQTTQQHTPEPWVTGEGYEQADPGIYIHAANGLIVLSDDVPLTKEVAARIVACVNAMAGKSDPSEYVSRAEDLATNYNELQVQYANVTDQRDELHETVKRLREQAKQDEQHINGLAAQVQELTKERDELLNALKEVQQAFKLTKKPTPILDQLIAKHNAK